MSSQKTETEDFGASHCSLVFTRDELIDELTTFLLDKYPWQGGHDQWAWMSMHHSDLEYDELVRNLFAVEFVDGVLSRQKQICQESQLVQESVSIEPEHDQQMPKDQL